MSNVTPQWKMRRLAARSARIVKRRASEFPVIAAFESTLLPKAEKYIAAYDGAARYQATWKKEMAEGRGAISALVKVMQQWVPLLKRDIAGFDGGIYGDKPDVPDDVLEDGERLLGVIDEHRDAQGQPLVYRKAALDALSPALAAAIKEWSEAEAADREVQQSLAQVRAHAAALQQDLVVLRRALMATVGHADRGYQKLRVERAGLADDDDDANAPASPRSIEPAKPGANPPT